MAIGCRKVRISCFVLPIADSFVEPTAAEPSEAIVLRSRNRSEPATSVTLL